MMDADLLTISHALDKCLEDCLWQHGMEIVSDDPIETGVVTIDNKERIQELEWAIQAIKRIKGN